MPGNNYLRKAWFETMQLVEHFKGATLFTLAGHAVNAPASWPAFIDLRTMLCARGGNPSNNVSLTTSMTALFNAGGMPGTWGATINAADRVVFDSEESFIAHTFSSDLYGFIPGVTYTSALNATTGRHEIVAPREWIRGNYQGADATFTVQGTGVTPWLGDYLPDTYGTYQSLPATIATQIAKSGADLHSEGRPLDNVGQLIVSTLTAEAVGSAGIAARLVVLDAGKVRFCVLDGVTLPSLDTDFCAWLGFHGSETWTQVGAGALSVWEATATDYPQGTLHLDRPVGQVQRDPINYGNAQILSDGYIDRTHVLTLEQWTIAITLQGIASEYNSEAQARVSFFKYLWQSGVFTFWPDRLEGRHAVPEQGLDRQDYSHAVTPEWQGTCGGTRLALMPDIKRALLTLQNPRTTKLYQPVKLSGLPYVKA